jgi:3,4-dihydroxy-2-butanone 4-phosphate synthase
MFSVLLALAAAPAPLTAAQAQQIRCVAVLAIVAGEQQRRTAAALDLPPLARQGARFAQVVGDTVVKKSGRTQEQVRDLILGQVAATQKAAGKDARLPLDDARACVDVMNAVAPPLPPPGTVQCAGLAKLAADDVKRREGMSKAATDLITIAALLESRARAELGEAGKSEAESDKALTLAREAIAANPQSAPDMEACVELAQP